MPFSCDAGGRLFCFVGGAEELFERRFGVEGGGTQENCGVSEVLEVVQAFSADDTSGMNSLFRCDTVHGFAVASETDCDGICGVQLFQSPTDSAYGV